MNCSRKKDVPTNNPDQWYHGIVNLSPLVGTPLLAFALTVLLHLVILRIFPRLGLLDFPERYNLTRKRLPYPTGIAAVIIFLVIFPLLEPISSRNAGLIGAIMLLGCSTLIDDRRPLPAVIRLTVQCLCAFIIFATGDCIGSRICSVTNPLEPWFGVPIIELNGTFPILSLLVTVIWLMLTTNALNWFDGIPGQVNTLSTIGFATIGLLALSDRVNQPQFAIIAFVLAAISFGSLLFDIPPPKVVIGDTGSMFFGLMLGTLTILAGGKVATAFLVLGVPIFDLLFVIAKRISEGRSPFRGSMSGEHLHHRLLAKGWSPRSIIGLTAGIGLLFGSAALFLDTLGKLLAAVVLFCVMLFLWSYSAPPKKQLI